MECVFNKLPNCLFSVASLQRFTWCWVIHFLLVNSCRGATIMTTCWVRFYRLWGRGRHFDEQLCFPCRCTRAATKLSAQTWLLDAVMFHTGQEREGPWLAHVVQGGLSQISVTGIDYPVGSLPVG